MDIACAIVLRDGRVLIQERERNGVRVHEFPTGKCDAGEDFTTAAIRELQEETGLQATPLVEPYIIDTERRFRIGFVQLYATDEPRITNAVRAQIFHWMQPADIPLQDFHPADQQYIRTVLLPLK